MPAHPRIAIHTEQSTAYLDTVRTAHSHYIERCAGQANDPTNQPQLLENQHTLSQAVAAQYSTSKVSLKRFWGQENTTILKCMLPNLYAATGGVTVALIYRTSKHTYLPTYLPIP